VSVVDPRLVERVRARLAVDAASGLPTGPPTSAGVAAALRAERRVLGDRSLREELAALGSELGGLGALQPLAADPAVTDILVTAPDEVWVERDGRLVATGVRLPDETAVRVLAQRLARLAGTRLDAAVPFADARLPGGVRLHAVLSPTSRRGTCLSLRVASRQPLDLPGLEELRALDGAMADVLRALVAGRVTALVTGGTGSGKTTVLGALLELVPADERVVVVEETGELAPRHPHVVLLEGRPANVEGAGAVTVADLVRQALRMRPDRFVVGEVRGAEVTQMLTAFNTGHEGCLGTVHANGAADVPARIEALALGAGMGRDAVRSQLAAGLDAVVHLARAPDGRRTVREVAVVRPTVDGQVEVVPAWTYDGDRTRPGPGARIFAQLTSRSAGVGPRPT
jgi:pilus assembly protein CpaF